MKENRSRQIKFTSNFNWIPLLCALLFAACADETFVNKGSVGKEGTPVKVNMSVAIPSFDTPGTTARSGESESDKKVFRVYLDSEAARKQAEGKAETRSSSKLLPLRNLWVLQFGDDKKLRKALKIAETPEPVKGMITIDAELFTGSGQTIYLVALGPKYPDVSLTGIADISDLESFKLKSIENVDGVAQSIIQSDEDIPYQGSCGGLEIVQIETEGSGYIDYDKSSGFNGEISMYSMVAKVTFNFSYKVTGYTPEMIMLNNVPTEYPIKAPAGYKPSQVVNLPANELSGNDFADGKRKEIIWYMAPNEQGVVNSIATETERYFYYDTDRITPIGTAPELGTYINLWAKKDNISTADYALYYIFLGGNTNNDFNVNPHSHYLLRSDIDIAPDSNDKRVISRALKQDIDIAASGMVETAPYSIWNKLLASKRMKSEYDLDAHPETRPIEISALRGKVQIEVLETAESSTPCPKENSWIKLSTSPNYTEALSHELGNAPQGLTTSITFDATIPGLFKLYLYSDEYEKYTTGNPAISSALRKLYIRFTFTNTGGTQEQYLCYFNQRPAFYVGRFGGEIRQDNGEYTDGLACEVCVNYGQYLSYYPSTLSLMRGYYPGVNYATLISKFKVDERDNGKEATRLLAEDEPRYPIDASINTIETPRWLNGYPDLYQYKYYTKDGFAIRSCYDRNRDKNGNGRIDKEEMVWYLPAYYQAQAFFFNYYANEQVLSTLLGVHYLGSTTMTEPTYFHTISPAFLMKSTPVYVENTMSYRCVRDVKSPVEPLPGETFSKGPKVEIEEGYAVIDASGLVSGASVYKRKGDNVYIREDGRNVRHISNVSIEGTPNRYVSARFRVAPKDINDKGEEVTKITTMDWAIASGFDTAGNSLQLEAALEKADTGCPIYKGRTDINDPYKDLGEWRLPTAKELLLIENMEKALVKTSADTKFEPLSATSKMYWSSTEFTTKSLTEIASYAICLDETRSTREYTRIHKQSTKKTAGSVRCVQDLPAK